MTDILSRQGLEALANGLPTDKVALLVVCAQALATARRLAEWLETTLCMNCRSCVHEWKDGKFTLCEAGPDEPFPCDEIDDAARAWLEGR